MIDKLEKTLAALLRTILPESHYLKAVEGYLPHKYRRDVRQRRLTDIFLFVTNRCNSRCRTCAIWKKRPPVDMDPKLIEKIVNQLEYQNLRFAFLGGEFFLHPQYQQILALFDNRPQYFFVVTNGILTDRIVSAARNSRLKSVMISLNGDREEYSRDRGVDAFDSVLSTILELKKMKVKVMISYTLNRFNDKDDFLFVEKLCKENDLQLVPVFYSEPCVLGVAGAGYQHYNQDVLSAISSSCLTDKYHRIFYEIYHEWLEGKVSLPCQSIFRQVVVLENADVLLCSHLDVVLGNLHQAGPAEIWTSEKTIALQKEYSRCNRCWSECHRVFDLTIHKGKYKKQAEESRA